jgi:predicted RNA-binding Zn ribbon-like protein
LEKKLQERYARFERFDLDGGHPVLDFTNTTDTVELRGTGKDDDYLGDYLDLLAWCHRTGYLPETAINELAQHAARHPKEAAAALEKARELREAVFGLLHAWLQGHSPPSEQMAIFNRHLRQALARAFLHEGSTPGKGFTLDLEHSEKPLEDVALRLAQQAADLLTSLDTAREMRMALSGQHTQRQPALVRHGRLRQPRQGQEVLQQEKRGPAFAGPVVSPYPVHLQAYNP